MKRFQITDALASKRSFGHPIVGIFATELPIAEDVGPVRALVGPATHIDPPAPAEVELFLEAHLPRHARGVAAKDPAGIRRRLQRAGTPKTRLEFRRAFEALGLAPTWFPWSPERDESAACGDSLWPWDEEGASLDVGQAEVEAEAQRMAEEIAEAARIAALPNKRSLGELGLIGVFIPLGSSPASWPQVLTPGSSFGLKLDEAATLRSATKVEGGHIVIFACPEECVGLDMPEGPLAGSTCTIIANYIPERAPVKAPKMPSAEWLSLRRADQSLVQSTRDGRTAEGEKAEEDLRARMRPHMRIVAGIASSTSRPAGAKHWAPVVQPEGLTFGARLFVQIAIRGYGLSAPLARHVYSDELDKFWRSIGADGPAPTVSSPRMNTLVDEALTGTRAWLSPDELYKPPSATFLERFVDFFSSDQPFKAALDEATADKDVVSTQGLVDALARAGLIEGQASSSDYQRISRLMTAATWTSRQVAIDGKRVRGYSR